MPNNPPPKHPPRTPLERLRRGELDRNGYLDAKVTEATARLGPLPASHLLWIHNVLRELCETDPILVHLVRRVLTPDN